ncbi:MULTISPECIES: peptide deformylase [unclassified Clostridioides]|uniref:peptide deformylase n=1 Tax=unclassified Clostridioides TaxID=2635829 RepID=UPI001D0FB2B6|nr:peptide deformylase [Clostridioides sp. ZZV14-6150]MCC0667239.1 peptide deformylase [Clostridioides sp. ZZV14-6153]MCC0721150.1 peptide deformylase [Clostridioides sp. ZZV14-6104]MCC0726883.1 peptide deformylase [Clostridioides sp. ZZV14-6045]MCC0730262.1 peptide deformylase [Clostridioides sp. ZZV14-6048]MCC0733140.1 peptide deformylase [Clostridioides sp. ZZV14-6009]MCC0737326.1 peptide deformylase [Clostridioides sp. ZZV14-5902]MCC0741041.1 peptide deformylase [Clostridioides sp. ZZV14
MALRQIVQIGEPVLRKKSKKVEKIDAKIIQLLDDMAETMYDADGVGLAAPQVGILKRVVVIDIGEELIELINPEIIETSGEQIDDEGCLSVVGESGEVRRPNYVKVRALNRNGETIELEGEELLARAFCHEIDHLDGILFVDKIEK